MSIKQIYVIRDSKAECYDPPMTFLTHAEAERAFATWSNDPKTKLGQFPTDFDLYHSGSFDDCSGKLEINPSPVHMVKAINLVKSEPKALSALQ